jgi:hypothetical protein
MADISITIKDQEFQEAMTQYGAAWGKAAPAVYRKQLKNWCFQTLKYLSEAQKGAIEKLRTQVKLIAYLLVKNHPERSERRTNYFGQREAAMINAATDRSTRGALRQFRRQKRGVAYRGRAVHYTIEQAKKFARRHFGARIASIAFVRAYVGAMIRAIPGGGASASGVRSARGVEKSYSEKVGVQAMVGVSAAFEMRSKTRARQDADPDRMEVRVIRAFNLSKSSLIFDIQKQTALRLQDEADRISGKSA